MAGADKLDPLLRELVQQGFLTEAQALDVDALADGLADRVRTGELTVDAAGEFAAKQGAADALAWRRKRKPA